MMQEKDMVADYLSMINSSLTNYANIISQCNNLQLRQTFQQMRNSDEARQLKVYEIAKQKGYYKPAQQASQNEISAVKNEFMQAQAQEQQQQQQQNQMQ